MGAADSKENKNAHNSHRKRYKGRERMTQNPPQEFRKGARMCGAR